MLTLIIAGRLRSAPLCLAAEPLWLIANPGPHIPTSALQGLCPHHICLVPCLQLWVRVHESLEEEEAGAVLMSGHVCLWLLRGSRDVVLKQQTLSPTGSSLQPSSLHRTFICT